MKRWIQVAFFKALFISVVFNLICLIYGSVTRNPYKISLSLEVIFFLSDIRCQFVGISVEEPKKIIRFYCV